MKTNFTIKNFRVFDENGVDIELAPITILTGKNSAGKSSIVKAITLLDSFLKQIKWAKKRGEEIRIADYKIDFTTYPNSLLGGFDKVLHNNSHSECITFEYTIHSLMLSDDVRVELVFGMGEKDLIRNGYLQQYRIKTLENETIYSSSEKEGSWINLNLIKEQFKDFLIAEHAVHSYNSRYVEFDIEHKYSRAEYKEIRSAHIEQLNNFSEQRRDDTYKYVRHPFSSDRSIFDDCELSKEDVNWYYEHQTFFHIPIVENVLVKMSKEDLCSQIDKQIKDSQLSEIEKNVIVVFLNDFKLSDFETINKYIEKKEHKYLDRKLAEKRMSTIFPELADAGQMSIINRDAILWRDSVQEAVTIDLPGSEEEEQADCAYNTTVDFRKVFDALILIDALSNGHDINRLDLADSCSRCSKFYMGLTIYASKFIEEVLFPEWADTITYISTGRVEMNRIYKLDGQDDFSKLLKNYLEAKYLFERNNDSHKGFTNKQYVPDSFMNKWIQELELGHSVSVEREPSGYGIYVKLHKTDNDKGVVLADEGYGITQLVSILLSIETIILSNDGLDINRYYGMSSLDRFDDTSFHYAQRTIAIEEPEIHLHPAFQSKLADMFASASEYNIHFIVETHSEYLVRRCQRIVAEKKYEDEKTLSDDNIFKVIYCPQNGNPYDMGWNIYGRFTNFFDEGFFDVASKDAIAVSKLERSRI